MSLFTYEFIAKHLLPLLRVFFIARILLQIHDLYYNHQENELFNKLLNDGHAPLLAGLRYILMRSCESFLPLLGLASNLAIISRVFQKIIMAFIMVGNNESASNIGSLAGWLFIVLCLQWGITSLDDEDRFWRLLKNLVLIVVVNLHSLYDPISERLQSLSTSRSKTIHKHARVLLISTLLIALPCLFLKNLWSQTTINNWTITVTLVGLEMVVRMSISLVIYTMCMINSFCDIAWRGLEDQIFYLKAFSGSVSYILGISLFFNSAWVLLFENLTIIKALCICLHLYFNIWIQGWKGWSLYLKRRQASSKINHLRNATKQELLDFDDVCSICFQVLNHAKVTRCNHYFHDDCLTRWLYIQDTCPICCSNAAISGKDRLPNFII